MAKTEKNLRRWNKALAPFGEADKIFGIYEQSYSNVEKNTRKNGQKLAML